MLIRCEKCSTLYDLDDKLLPAHGAPVQCSKCQFVFKAYPEPPKQPASPDPAEQADPSHDPEAEPSGARLEAADEHESDLVREGGTLVAERSERVVAAGANIPRSPAPQAPPAPRPPATTTTTIGEQQFTADGRPIRKVPFPTSEPTQPNPRAPVAVKRSGPALGLPMRWVVPAAVVVLVIVIALAWWMIGRSHGGGAQPQARQPARQSRIEVDVGKAAPATLPEDPAPHAAPDPYAPAGVAAAESGVTRATAPAGTPGTPTRN